MAAKNTKNTANEKKTGAGQKKATEKKQTGTKASVIKSTGKSAGKGVQKATEAKRSTRKREVAPEPKEELVPELSNELILLIALVVSVLLFLSNFSLSGKVGEFINQATFGLVGFLAYMIPFLLFFGIAFYLANRENNKRYIVKLVASIGLFAIVAALLQLVFGQTTDVEFLDYYKMSAEQKNGGGLLGGLLCFIFVPLFGKVGSYVVLIALALLCIMILTGKALFALLAEVSGREMQKQKELYEIRSEEKRLLREEQRLQKEEQRMLRKEQLQSMREEQERNQGRSKAQSFLLQKEEEKVEEAPKEEPQKNFFGGVSKTVPVGYEEERSVAEEPALEPGAAYTGQLREEQEQAAFVRAEQERMEQARTQEERAEQARIRAEQVKAAQERAALARAEQEKLEQEKRAQARAERIKAARIQAEQTKAAEQANAGMQEFAALDKETEELIYTGNFQPSQDTMDTVNSIYEEELRKKFERSEEERGNREVTLLQNSSEFQGPGQSGSDTVPTAEPVPDPLPEQVQNLETVCPEITDLENAALEQTVTEPVVVEEKPLVWPPMVPVYTMTTELPKVSPIEEPFEPSFSEQALMDKRQPESPVAKAAFEHTAYGVPVKKPVEERSAPEPVRAAGSLAAPVPDMAAKAANAPTAADVAQVAEEAMAAQEEKLPEYQFPPIDLLTKPVVKETGASEEEELKQTADKLKSTLESFGVRVSINNVSRGPSVTRYEIQPEQGVKVSKITGLADDIKLNLAAADVRIEAPIPGKAAVGIEVPNKENTAVLLRELIESPEFTGHGSSIAFTVGKDIGGQNIVADIGKMPHLLIAGSTGSGKSVCINTIIMSILYKAHPDDVKLIMVDPKVVELSVYNGIPHLLIPVVTDPKKASAALNWAVTEMLERYDKFAALSVRDLKGYNERVEEAAKEGLSDEKFPRLPQIVIIVDELADLMMVAPGEVEDAICRLAQMARAAGLHLILATQRPSVNVITGLIKANVPSRVAFAVSSGIDSRTILDSVGAEKLLGKGDMLFFPSGYPKPVRIQGAFVSDKEVSHVVDFLKGQSLGRTGYSEEITKKIASGMAPEAGGASATGGSDNGFDEYFAEAGRFIIEKDKASIGMLQRVYKIGFNRAARIMDQLAEAGVVGPEEGTKPRKIMMSQEEFENYLEEQ